jgi:glutaredoxin
MLLTMYSTEHCTVCKQALDLLLSMPESRGATLDLVDVAADAVLVERYGPRLPVLVIGARELDWPFTRAEVAAALVHAQRST